VRADAHLARGRESRLATTSTPTSQGLDPFKIAGASISGWYPSTKTASGRHPFTSQLEFALGLYLEYHPLVVSYQRGDLSSAFARAHHLDAPLGTPYAIAYAFGEKPHVYLPDYVGTLVGGGLLVAEAGRVEEADRLYALLETLWPADGPGALGRGGAGHRERVRRQQQQPHEWRGLPDLRDDDDDDRLYVTGQRRAVVERRGQVALAGRPRVLPAVGGRDGHDPVGDE